MTKDDYIKQGKDGKLDRYYVYLHRKLTDNSIFYVGKGNRDRAWYTHNRSDYWHKIKNKHGFVVDIVFDNLLEEDALSVEVDVIQELSYFGAELCNHTHGGEGKTHNKELLARNGELHRDKNEYTFVNLKTEEVFKGTRKEFSDFNNIKVNRVNYLFVGQKIMKMKSANDWILSPNGITPIEALEMFKLQRTKPPKVVRVKKTNRTLPSWNKGIPNPMIRGNNNPAADTTQYTFCRVSDGLVFNGTRYELCTRFNLDIRQFGKLYYVPNRKTSQGWELIKETNDNRTEKN